MKDLERGNIQNIQHAFTEKPKLPLGEVVPGPIAAECEGSEVVTESASASVAPVLLQS